MRGSTREGKGYEKDKSRKEKSQGRTNKSVASQSVSEALHKPAVPAGSFGSSGQDKAKAVKTVSASQSYKRPWHDLMKFRKGKTTWNSANAKARKKYKAQERLVELTRRTKILGLTTDQLKFKLAEEASHIIAEAKRREQQAVRQTRETLSSRRSPGLSQARWQW